jgi:hypothetical protein
LKKKSPSTIGLNASDYRLLQKLLPLFSPDVTRINELVGFVRRNGTVCYFNYQMPIYHHSEDDIASFKVFLCQLILIGNATPSQIKRTFRLANRELNHWLKQYSQEGPAGFYRKAGQIKKTEVKDVHSLLTHASKLMKSIVHLSSKLKKQKSD